MDNSITNIPRTLINWWIQAVKDFYTVEKPDNLTRKWWLQSVDYFSNMHFCDTEAVIAIGGEAKKKPKYPSSTIAQMTLWALRKQGDYELPITIALNLAPALGFNEMDKKDFYSEKEQQSRIIRDLKTFGATLAELTRVRFDLSTQNPKYLDMIGSIKSGNMWAFPLYKKLLDAFEKDTKFSQDIWQCIPEQVKTNGQWESSFHYALIEIHEIIEAYKKGQRIKIGYKREKLYDRVFVNILDGAYEELLDITRELNHQQNWGGILKWNQLFGSVYWDERADRNSMRLREKLINKKICRQILYATPVIISMILWWKYHQYEMEKVKEKAYRDVLWEQRSKMSDEFHDLDELNKSAKWLDYTEKFYTVGGFRITYEWRDIRIKAIEEVSKSIAMSLDDYRNRGKDFGDIKNLKTHVSRQRHMESRFVSLEMAKILEEDTFKEYIARHDFNSTGLSDEFYNDITEDLRFAKIFKLYTGEDWEDTPEFKKKVFYYYGK